MEDLVSIIVPVYNAGNYIEYTMHMACAQTYRNWEMILVDDCSTDGSYEVIQSYIEKLQGQQINGVEINKDRYRLVRLSQNSGPAIARNEGIKEAKGRFIAFLDADDVWLTPKLEKQIAFMEETSAAFSYTTYEFGDEQAEGTGRLVHAMPELTYQQALTRTIIFTSTVMFDLTRITKDEIMMPNCVSEDTATWWKIMRSGVVAHGLDEKLAIYRRPEVSLSSNKAEATKRFWQLLRQQEKLSIIKSCTCFVGWAVRATLRRM